MKAKGKRSRRIGALVIFLAICAGLYAWIYIVPGISGALARTTIVSHGNLRVSDAVEGYIVRDERVITANATGRASYYIDEGMKTRKGTKVADIYPQHGSVSGYHVSHTGIVSYYIDGLEEVFTPDTIREIDFLPLAEGDVVPKDTKREHITAGEPLYKLVTDDVWHVVLPLGKEQLPRYEVGAAVKLEFETSRIAGLISDIFLRGEQAYVVIETDRYFESFARVRSVDLTVITEDYEGLIIPNSAIAWEDGLQGVYVKDLSGAFHFTRISIITGDGEYSLIQSDTFNETDDTGETTKINTVKIYDEILRRSETKE